MCFPSLLKQTTVCGSLKKKKAIRIFTVPPLSPCDHSLCLWMSCPTPNQGQPHHLSTRAHLLLSIQENCSNRSLLCLLDYFYLSLCWVIPGIIGTNCYYSCLKKKKSLKPTSPLNKLPQYFSASPYNKPFEIGL